MKNKKRLHIWALLIGIIMTVLLCAWNTLENVRQTKAEATHVLEVYATRAESLLDSLFHKTDVLESVIITSNGNVPESTFNDLAASLMQSPGIRAIQYLPNGVVQYCYPIKGNEKAIGDDIFEIPERREDALLAVRTQEITLSGPYQLTQGGLGLVARNPIFITSEEGIKQFWGFSVIVLDLPDALQPLLLEELAYDHYQYRMSTIVNAENITIAQSTKFDAQNPVTALIEVPGHTWELALYPEQSWINIPEMLIYIGVGLSMTVLCMIIIRMLLERNEQLRCYADMDILTGVANRRKLNEYFERCRKTEHISMVLFYIDVDKFKSINDTYGHSQGDVLLKVYADRMRRFITEKDIVARLGGDEFVILMSMSGLAKACDQQIFDLKDILAKEVTLDKATIHTSASIGYALYPSEATQLTELLELADKRMYTQKERVLKD